MAIIAMGKLGGGELNYHSDLDIIYVYDHQGMTDGEKQITNHEYFAKLAQKIISILTTADPRGVCLQDRHPSAPLGECRSAGDLAGIVSRIPPQGGPDLGAAGADQGAGCTGRPKLAEQLRVMSSS